MKKSMSDGWKKTEGVIKSSFFFLIYTKLCVVLFLALLHSALIHNFWYNSLSSFKEYVF